MCSTVGLVHWKTKTQWILLISSLLNNA
uniref:Uncharacterized protein n=1 Tax=Arundo donax TaxID=35708 RepID=A0A0A8ZGB5_ARUDO